MSLLVTKPGPEFSRKNVELRVVPGRGRSAFAARQFKGGDFVCEYRGEVREKQEDDWGDRRNASLGIGSYCFDATHEGKTYVFDASGSINDPGRYINHASKNCNLQKMPPVMIVYNSIISDVIATMTFHCLPPGT